MENKWVGEVCDICGKTFTETDEVVICPECGAPYHKSCIAQTKQCVHPELHEAGKAWESSKKVSAPDRDEIICPRCGKHNASGAHFCSQCGMQLALQAEHPAQNPYAQGAETNPYGAAGGMGSNPFIEAQRIAFSPYAGLNPDEEMEEDVTYKEAAAYIGKNQRYFLPRFKLMKQRVMSMNFSAFLFGGLYYLYRKVYGMGILLLIAQLLLSIPAFISGMVYAANLAGLNLPFSLNMNVVSNIDMICSLLRMILMFVCGFLFNRMYKNHVVGQVKKEKSKHLAGQQLADALAAKGGVNFALIIVLMIAYFAVYYVIVLAAMRGLGS